MLGWLTRCAVCAQGWAPRPGEWSLNSSVPFLWQVAYFVHKILISFHEPQSDFSGLIVLTRLIIPKTLVQESHSSLRSAGLRPQRGWRLGLRSAAVALLVLPQPPLFGLHWLPGTWHDCIYCHTSLCVPGAVSIPSLQMETLGFR